MRIKLTMFNDGVGHLVHHDGWHKDPDEPGDHGDHDAGGWVGNGMGVRGKDKRINSVVVTATTHTFSLCHLPNLGLQKREAGELGDSQ